MTVKGTGRIGNRLWMRTPDKRWIEVPYGAGQDPKVRSINVWSGTEWLTPAYGQTVRDQDGPVEPTVMFGVDALDVYTPTVSWINENNPTYYYRTYPYNDLRTFAPQHQNWTRLFHVRPRVDPTWRIVPLEYPLPMRVPNVRVNQYNDTLYFWPSRTAHTVTVTDGVLTDNHNPNNSQGNRPPHLAQTSRALRSSPAQFEHANVVSHQVGLIDLAAIRQRLETDFAEQGVDYTGQYHTITKQKLRRVIVRADVWITLHIEGHGTVVDDTIADQTTWTLRAPGNVTTTAEHIHDYATNRAFDVHYPTDTTSATGQDLITVNAADLTVAITPAQFPGGSNTYNIDLQTTEEWTFEAPGENNIAFFTDITGLPQLSTNDSTIEYINAYMRVTPTRITLHYSDEGVDTPYDTHNPDSLG